VVYTRKDYRKKHKSGYGGAPVALIRLGNRHRLKQGKDESRAEGGAANSVAARPRTYIAGMAFHMLSEMPRLRRESYSFPGGAFKKKEGVETGKNQLPSNELPPLFRDEAPSKKNSRKENFNEGETTLSAKRS